MQTKFFASQAYKGAVYCCSVRLAAAVVSAWCEWRERSDAGSSQLSDCGVSPSARPCQLQLHRRQPRQPQSRPPKVEACGAVRRAAPVGVSRVPSRKGVAAAHMLEDFSRGGELSTRWPVSTNSGLAGRRAVRARHDLSWKTYSNLLFKISLFCFKIKLQ